uniref:Zinc finger protein 629-like isoform X2 n=1 Tax=Petromyzon marinus TaxID=7757 RepID=A0AAJ7X9Y3_PETMA|nr:zinc finger protein 629-like isoform X2 [Petromyzon marinus]
MVAVRGGGDGGGDSRPNFVSERREVVDRAAGPHQRLPAEMSASRRGRGPDAAHVEVKMEENSDEDMGEVSSGATGQQHRSPLRRVGKEGPGAGQELEGGDEGCGGGEGWQEDWHEEPRNVALSCVEVEDDCPGDGAAVENGNAEEEGSGWSHRMPTVNEGDAEESSDSSDDEEDEEKEVRLQVCGVCWKEFPRLSCLKRHLTSHTGEKAFPCSACGKHFSSTSSLNRHRKTHEEVKPFVCTVCERQFSHLDYLRSHQRTHTKEKPYACSKCGKAFTRLTYVREHEQAHTGARPYACELCGKTFPYKTNMKIHMKKHGEKKEV